MARCGCVGASCSCKIESGHPGTKVEGSGSLAHPYRISASEITSAITSTVDMHVNGVDPYVISADATVTLDDLTDVDVSASTTGQVLGRLLDGTWGGVPASVSDPGAISVGCGIDGDGSPGSPLRVQVEGAGYIECAGSTAGIGLAAQAITRIDAVPDLQADVLQLEADVVGLGATFNGTVPLGAAWETFTGYRTPSYRLSNGWVDLMGTARRTGGGINVPLGGLTHALTDPLPSGIQMPYFDTWMVVMGATNLQTGVREAAPLRIVYDSASHRLFLLAAQGGTGTTHRIDTTVDWVSLSGIGWQVGA